MNSSYALVKEGEELDRTRIDFRSVSKGGERREERDSDGETIVRVERALQARVTCRLAGDDRKHG